MKHIPLLLLCCLLFSCMKIGKIQQAPMKMQQTDYMAYHIGVFDELDIRVWKNDELSISTLVRPDGKISVPLVGETMAVGKTPRELEQEILKGLAVYIKEPKVTVIPKTIKSMSFFIIGNVRNPGRYELLAKLDVLKAVAVAGGFTDFADADQVFIEREAQGQISRIGFSYAKYLQGDSDDRDFQIHTGDLIVVP